LLEPKSFLENYVRIFKKDAAPKTFKYILEEKQKSDSRSSMAHTLRIIQLFKGLSGITVWAIPADGFDTKENDYSDSFDYMLRRVSRKNGYELERIDILRMPSTKTMETLHDTEGDNALAETLSRVKCRTSLILKDKNW
jgi:hypothetical protein